MYACTVVQPTESIMNLKPAVNFALHLKKNCNSDQTAADLIDRHLSGLKAVIQDVRTPEQIARNSRYLDQIKARLSETQPATARTLRGSKLNGVAK